MNKRSVISILVLFFGLFTSQFSMSSTVSSESYHQTEQVPIGFAQSVSGLWTYSQRIEFDYAGTYELQLEDLGVNELFGAFDYLGAFITTSTDKIASFTYADGVTTNENPVIFDINSGDYWLNIVAVTDSRFNLGLLGVNVSEYTPVPLPPAFVLMFASIVGLFTCARRNKKS